MSGYDRWLENGAPGVNLVERPECGHDATPRELTDGEPCAECAELEADDEDLPEALAEAAAAFRELGETAATVARAMMDLERAVQPEPEGGTE